MEKDYDKTVLEQWALSPQETPHLDEIINMKGEPTEEVWRDNLEKATIHVSDDTIESVAGMIILNPPTIQDENVRVKYVYPVYINGSDGKELLVFQTFPYIEIRLDGRRIEASRLVELLETIKNQ